MIKSNKISSTLSLIGLLVAVIGTGCTRSNIITFGGNQYKLPEQSAQLKLYFSLQVFALKIGTLLGQLVAPIVKEDVECFGMFDCYPLAFSIAAVVLMATFVLFLCGRPFYIHTPVRGNMLVKVVKCILVRIEIRLMNQNYF